MKMKYIYTFLLILCFIDNYCLAQVYGGGDGSGEASTSISESLNATSISMFNGGSSSGYVNGNITEAVNGDVIDVFGGGSANGYGFFSLSESDNTDDNNLFSGGIAQGYGFFSEDNLALLPVELVGFRAKYLNKVVELKWGTASELNNDFFSVQRSTNGATWETIEEVEGAINSSSFLTYNTIDSKPLSGRSYYRLKQTDLDGTYSYSNIQSIVVRSNLLGDISLVLYPNPTNGIVTVEGDEKELSLVQVFNILGRNVTALVQKSGENITKKSLNLSQLVDGVYFIKTRTMSSVVYKQ